MMKTFKITYKRYGNCATYDHEETVFARSAKMALKKFWNYREYPRAMSNLECMRYERDCNGISWSEPVVTEIVDA